ncbi:hypothetical protein [Micromonospora rubida]|uniref:hypothetical protein n=1 Tax=Micromonospora rubida TaxID=2697657 RepID=UPI00137704F4|nr:hypothetical protein [Micromonospora rubida]NBE81904.1 hypothetical protein [Micromonospora rubida]
MGLDVVLYRLVHPGPGRRRPSYASVQVVADPRDVLVSLARRCLCDHYVQLRFEGD